MRLSDVMSAMNLTTYPIIGLVTFLIVFAAVSARAMSRRRTQEYRHAAHLPLDQEIMSFDPNAARGSRP